MGLKYHEKKIVHLSYIAHITTLSGKLKEDFETNAENFVDLIAELDRIYPGMKFMFIDERTKNLKINSMIFYSTT